MSHHSASVVGITAASTAMSCATSKMIVVMEVMRKKKLVSLSVYIALRKTMVSVKHMERGEIRFCDRWRECGRVKSVPKPWFCHNV